MADVVYLEKIRATTSEGAERAQDRRSVALDRKQVEQLCDQFGDRAALGHGASLSLTADGVAGEVLSPGACGGCGLGADLCACGAVVPMVPRRVIAPATAEVTREAYRELIAMALTRIRARYDDAR